jgi:N-acyl-D-amino-acid deacylase
MNRDIVIRGGTVIDGSGHPGEIADVAVKDGRIDAVGRSLPAGSARTIDAEGLAVAPGFIDIKTHSDFTLPINPKAEQGAAGRDDRDRRALRGSQWRRSAPASGS